MADVTVSRVFDASVEDVWKLVSDPTRMGEWSPENTGAKWVGGANGPSVGAKFKGSNASGRVKWSTTCTVTACDEHERFEFHVDVGPVPVSLWGYELESVDEGTKVTEYWTRTEPKIAAVVLDKLMRVPNRAEHNRANMQETLDAMAAAVEG